MWDGRRKRQRVVERYIAALNAHDYPAIEPLIHADCRMIDSRGEYVTGRDIVLRAVRRFMDLEPDFRIEVATIDTNAQETLITGQVFASRPELAVDTLWRARSTSTHLVEWQSFAPTAAPALSRILAGDEARGPIEVDRLILRGSD